MKSDESDLSEVAEMVGRLSEENGTIITYGAMCSGKSYTM
jgi:hypothetical protein